MASLKFYGLSAPGQTCLRVGANRIQKTFAGEFGALFRGDERAGAQRLEQRGQLIGGHKRIAADGRRGFQGPARLENRQSLQEHALRFRQSVITPVKNQLESLFPGALLSLGKVTNGAGQVNKRFLRLRSETAYDKFHGKRNTVQERAKFGKLASVEVQSDGKLRRAITTELFGLRAAVLTGGMQGRNTVGRFVAKPEALTCTDDELDVGTWASQGGHEACAGRDVQFPCVQYQQRFPVVQQGDQGIRKRGIGSGLRVERPGDHTRHDIGVGDRRQFRNPDAIGEGAKHIRRQTYG